MALSIELRTQLNALDTAFQAARETGAHLAVEEGNRYFPKVDGVALNAAIATQDRKTLRAIHFVSSACGWKRIDERSIESIGWALSHIDWVLRTERKVVEAQQAQATREQAERDKLVTWCATVHGLCNAARQKLGRDLLAFSSAELTERQTETLREQHRVLLEKLSTLNAEVAAMDKAGANEQPRERTKPNGKSRAVPHQPQPQRPRRDNEGAKANAA